MTSPQPNQAMSPRKQVSLAKRAWKVMAEEVEENTYKSKIRKMKRKAQKRKV